MAAVDLLDNICAEEKTLESFLKALGVGMLRRNAAWAFGYGVNKARLNIDHDGDSFEWETVGLKTFTNHISIDGTEQTTVDGNGEEQIVIASWSDDGKTLKRQRVGGDSKYADVYTETYFDDEEMLVIKITCGDIISTRWFARQSKK